MCLVVLLASSPPRKLCRLRETLLLRVQRVLQPGLARIHAGEVLIDVGRVVLGIRVHLLVHFESTAEVTIIVTLPETPLVAHQEAVIQGDLISREATLEGHDHFGHNGLPLADEGLIWLLPDGHRRRQGCLAWDRLKDTSQLGWR